MLEFPGSLPELPLSFITMASSYHLLLEAVSMNWINDKSRINCSFCYTYPGTWKFSTMDIEKVNAKTLNSMNCLLHNLVYGYTSSHFSPVFIGNSPPGIAKTVELIKSQPCNSQRTIARVAPVNSKLQRMAGQNSCLGNYWTMDYEISKVFF